MKPILKNFSGSGVLKFQIRPEVKDGWISIWMYVKTPFINEWTMVDNCGTFYNKEKDDYNQCLTEALLRAEEKWGLKLIDEELNVA